MASVVVPPSAAVWPGAAAGRAVGEENDGDDEAISVIF